MKILAALMITVGVLIAGLCGLCTMEFSRDYGRGVVELGAPFILLGLLLLLSGILLWREPPKD